MGDSWGGAPRCATVAPLRRVALLTALWGLALLPGSDAAAQQHALPSPGKQAPWTQVSRLITGQRLTEAVRLLQATQKTALAAERADDAAHAAIRLAQVRMTLSHYELAVSVLHEQLAWQRQWQAGHGVAATASGAEADPAQALLALFYSQALLQYAQMYSFQVSRRERSAAPLPSELPFPNTLRAWTRQQLLTEAQLALAAAWEQRAALGTLASSSLPEYIEPGTLSRDEQPTLRDLLTYLYVELLVRLLHDRPQNQRWLATLQVSELLNKDGLGINGAGPQARYRHPLEEVAGVLGDLARWHQTAGRVGPWVAAQLELMSRLHAELGEADQRAQVRLRLSELLPAAGDAPVSARVHAALAEQLRQDAMSRPDAEASELLGRALVIATQGARRFPGVVAGQRCRRLAQSLTAPEFHLESPSAAAPGQPALQAAYKNLTVLYFRAYSYDPLPRLLAGGSDNLALSGAELQALLRLSKPVAAWATSLQETAELRLRKTKVVPPLQEPGTYLIVASPRADFAPAGNHLEAVRLTLSDLVLWATTEPHAVRITAVSGRTGEPLPDVELSSYAAADAANHALLPSASGRPGLTLLHRRRTSIDGSAELPPPESASSLVVVGQLGRESALIELAATQEPEEPEAAPSARITTDRSVYYPQQKLRWRVAAPKPPSERSPSPPGNTDSAPLTMALLDAEFQEVARAAVTTNRFGTAAGEFLLPRGRPLGAWRLVLGRGAERSGESLVRVEEPPQTGILMTLAEPESPRLGQAVTLCGSARYRAGGSVKRGFLRYKVTREAQSLARAEAAALSPAPPQHLIASGTQEVPADGRFTINFTAAEPTSDRSGRENGEIDVSRGGGPAAYRFRTSVELWADDGSSGVVQRSFALGTVLTQAEIRSEREFLRSEEPAKLEIIRRDLDGRPQTGAASWQLLRLPPRAELPAADQPLPSPATGPGTAALAQLRERPDGAEQARGELLHAADGRAELKLPGLPAGAYRLRYKSRDTLGRAYETARELVVVPSSGIGDTGLGLHAFLLRECASLRVGETARFAVGSAINGQALWLELRRADETVQTRVLHAGRDPMLVELPLQPTDRGTLVVTLTMVRDHQLLRLQQRVTVEGPRPLTPPGLQLSLSPFHDQARSGSRQSVRLTVKTASGAIPVPGTVELFAYAYDYHREQQPAERADRTGPDASGPDRAAAPEAGFVHSLASQASALQSDAPPRPDADRAAAQPDRLRLRLNFALLASGRTSLRGRDTAAALGQPDSTYRRGGDDQVGPSAVGGPAPDREFFAASPDPLSETPLFLPQLPLAEDGSAVLEFTAPAVPDPFYLRVEAQSRDESTGMATHAVRRAPEAQRCP